MPHFTEIEAPTDMITPEASTVVLRTLGRKPIEQVFAVSVDDLHPQDRDPKMGGRTTQQMTHFGAGNSQVDYDISSQTTYREIIL